MKEVKENSRRKFLGSLAVGSAAGLAVLTKPFESFAKTNANLGEEAETWFKSMKGSHRIVYDAPEPHNGFPFIWTWVYYETNNKSGVSDSDALAMVVLRHNGIPFAMKDELWAKYKFGEIFNVKDNSTGAPSIRNTFYTPQKGDFPMPQIQGIKDLQNRGAKFCVCDMALTVYSSMIAQKMNLDPEETKSEWVAGVLPEIEIVPSGVWAIGRAQEHGFGYCYAGG